MALPSTFRKRTEKLVTTGNIVTITPTDASYEIELWRAPDSSGSPNDGAKVLIARLPPMPITGGFYVDRLPVTGALYYYKHRHVRDNFSTGAFSPYSGGQAASDLGDHALGDIQNMPAVVGQWAISGTPPTFNVRDAPYNAKGDGVTDDRAAIAAANADAAAAAGEVLFPPGTYNVSDYITGYSGMVWRTTEAYPNVSPPTLTTVVATGTGKGVLRFRPGTIGSVAPTDGYGITLIGLGFSGGSSTGHLIDIARMFRFRARHCYFNNTSGSGKKDDQTTTIEAAAFHAFGCELLDFDGCEFSNNNNATGRGGSGLLFEKSVHMVRVANTHFNGNTNHVRFVDVDNGVILFTGGTNFNAGGCCLFADLGGFYCVTFDSCWAENQTGAIASGYTPANIITAGGSQFSRNIIVRGCKLTAGTQTNKDCFAFGAPAEYMLIEYNEIGNYTNVYNFGTSSSALGGNRARGNYYTGNTNIFLSGHSPSEYGFVEHDTGGGASAFSNFALTDGATVNIDASLANNFILSATVSPTIAAPTKASDGQRITITVLNSSGSTINTTWNAVFVFTVAWVDPLNGKRRTAFFRYDRAATKWFEIMPSIAAADVGPGVFVGGAGYTFPSGSSVVIGPDPGGSEILRVGGGVHVNGKARIGTDLEVNGQAYAPTNTVNVASGDTSKTINFGDGNVQKVVMANTASVALGLSNLVSGACYTLILQASGGSRSFTWGSTITWFGGAPDGTLSANLTTQLITLIYDGTNIMGFASVEKIMPA